MSKIQAVGDLFALARSRTVITYVLLGFLFAVLIVSVGNDIARHLESIELWLTRIGPWGVLAFIGFFVLTTSLLMPESVLSIVAGAVFGLGLGMIAVLIGSLLAAALQYMLSKRVLHSVIDRTLASRPSLLAIQRAVMHDELRLQALLRLTPLNPATTSYMLGAAGVRFPGFLLASLAMVPTMIIEVYFGYAGRHAAHMSGRAGGDVYLHDLIVFIGLAVTILVVILVSRAAHRAVLEIVSTDATSIEIEGS